MNFIVEVVHDYLVLFAMVNAVGNLPVFADLTQGMEPEVRSRVFRTAVLTAVSIVLSFAILGNWMLQTLFEVDTFSFKIAGGILVFIVASRGVMQGPRRTAGEHEHYENVAVFPMGFPFLAGPGSIVTTILLLQTGGSLTTAIAAGLVYLSIIPILHLVPFVEKVIGRVGIMITTRILYIFIAAKAVSFVLEGIQASFYP